MPRTSIACTLATVLALGLLPGRALAIDPLAGDSWTRVHALIKPSPAEQGWEKIPWLTSLWEARKQAAAAGKPILLWEMDGHPLGCT
jgi:hypothetical protein